MFFYLEVIFISISAKMHHVRSQMLSFTPNAVFFSAIVNQTAVALIWTVENPKLVRKEFVPENLMSTLM